MINVLFFASIRETLGLERTEVACGEACSVADVVLSLRQRGDVWNDILGNADLLCSVNQELVAMDAQLSDGDELGLFPPVTGG
ncbi:MoaD/ThiS family protein [Aliamphritea ceti]|uniref:MoaD/ThiS family protein n=1 Tax=Aliamphritea ceti TaxID=1524258 RepID=UPI0021C44CE3|nr:MoaD/ThiS family protein [Aliamphritea ceti]